jgi:hypothetical protein
MFIEACLIFGFSVLVSNLNNSDSFGFSLSLGLMFNEGVLIKDEAEGVGSLKSGCCIR